ncbi:proliferating cell nuclear antigen, N-terminal domain-containing protein [Gautieria morchelliformis]|nr:proliferating cell nuclear antigen, N-terminal domain-containing protein [Gautieria morchelliformis]
MLEARLAAASVLKRLLDAIKELVTDANFECNEEGLSLQAMDNSHVALVAVKLDADGFDLYRCDRPMPLGVNLGSLTKVLKCAKDDDIVTLKATDNGDILNLIYEAKNSDRVAEYDMKLMDIDTDALGIPDTEYEACVTMSAVEFGRICRDLSQLGESVRIEVSKEGVRFASDGEAANGNVLLKQTESARHRYAGWGVTNEDGAEGSKKKAKKAKKEPVKREDGGDEEAEVDEDGDVEEDDGGTFKAATSDQEGSDAGSEAEEEEGEEETTTKKKRKRASTSNGKKAVKKARKSADDGGDSGGVAIEMSQAVNLTFSLKYLVNFAKSGSLVDTVVLKMHSEVPLLVAYHFGQGSIQYYLAPKIGDE